MFRKQVVLLLQIVFILTALFGRDGHVLSSLSPGATESEFSSEKNIFTGLLIVLIIIWIIEFISSFFTIISPYKFLMEINILLHLIFGVFICGILVLLPSSDYRLFWIVFSFSGLLTILIELVLLGLLLKSI